MYRTRTTPQSRILLVAMLAVLAAPTLAGAADTESIALGWVEAFNSGDVETMGRFRAKHHQLSEAKNWQGTFDQMLDMFGRIQVLGVMIDARNEVKLVVETISGQHEMIFRFDEKRPDQILQVAVEAGGSASEMDLPELQFSNDNWSSRSPELDLYLRNLAEQDLFSGTVMVIEKGTVRFEGAYGLASREFGVPNTLETRFDVGSFNKDYTRLGILQLMVAGKLALSDKVGKHLPDYPNADVREKVTIQQLLDHRSGLGDYFTDEYFQTPMRVLRNIDDYIPIWGPKPLEFEPGSREQYSNFGYTILGAIIEKLSKMSYFEYVRQNVFEPAGMSDTGFFETDRPEPNVAVGYTHMNPSGEHSDELYKNIFLEPAQGGPWGKSYSTIRDLYRFFEAMFQNRLLPEEHNWLSRGWNIGGTALAGGGPGLNAYLGLDAGRMVHEKRETQNAEN
jgi:CubicO group peptidase (beta-lactamase class C family)